MIYEIHVSFNADGKNDPKDEVLQHVANYYDFKIIKVLNWIDGSGVLDRFTSSTCKGTLMDAVASMNNIAAGLRSIREVTRLKIETVPWHPLVPYAGGPIDRLSKDQYFETHMQFPSEIPTEELQAAGLLVSQNIKKPSVKMGTLRCDDLEIHGYNGLLSMVKQGLKVQPLKCITEFAIYDSNRGHDRAWEHR